MEGKRPRKMTENEIRDLYMSVLDPAVLKKLRLIEWDVLTKTARETKMKVKMLEPEIRDKISRENQLTAMEEGRTNDLSNDNGGDSKKNSGGNNNRRRCPKCGNYHSGECKTKRQYGGDGDRVGKGSGTPRFNKFQKEYLKTMGFD